MKVGTGLELAVNSSDNNGTVLDGTNANEAATTFTDTALREPTEMQVCAEDLGEIMHGLNNVLVSILLNAQFMEWKLPSYSQMRRNTHEIQRSAKRAGVLLKRLVGHSSGTPRAGTVTGGRTVSSGADSGGEGELVSGAKSEPEVINGGF